jgi:hypothetical protein
MSQYMLHVTVHAAYHVSAVYPCLCCMSQYMLHTMSLLYIHVYAACQCPHGCTCTCQCCIAMSVLHVPVYATCPCPCCITQYMLRVHVHVAGPCPCCMSMSMLFGLEHSASIWTCNIVILQSWIRIQQTPQPTLDCQSLDGLPSGMALPCRLSSEGRQRRI